MRRKRCIRNLLFFAVSWSILSTWHIRSGDELLHLIAENEMFPVYQRREYQPSLCDERWYLWRIRSRMFGMLRMRNGSGRFPPVVLRKDFMSKRQQSFIRIERINIHHSKMCATKRIWQNKSRAVNWRISSWSFHSQVPDSIGCRRAIGLQNPVVWTRAAWISSTILSRSKSNCIFNYCVWDCRILKRRT